MLTRPLSVTAAAMVALALGCLGAADALRPSDAAHARRGQGVLRGSMWAQMVMHSERADSILYASDTVTYTAPFENGRAQIDAEHATRMLASLRRNSARLSIDPDPTDPHYFQPRWLAGDRAVEALYALGAFETPSSPPPGDAYLETAAAASIQGPEYYAEDLIGDGSAIAELVIQRIANDRVRITLWLNGIVMATADLDYEPAAGGWVVVQKEGAAFDGNGSWLATGTIHTAGEVYMHAARPDATTTRYATALQAWSPVLALLDPLRPREAFAMAGCGYHQRRMLMYVAVMAFNGATGNPIGFFLGAAFLANELHAFGRCMER